MSVLFVKSKCDDYTGIEDWNVSNVFDMKNMFEGSPLEYNPPVWYKN